MSLANPNRALKALTEYRRGRTDAGKELFAIAYDELRSLAYFWLQQQSTDHMLQPTALVHEAFLKLFGHAQTTWEDHAHFVAVAATAMRQVLVDHARAQTAKKRGGDWTRITLDDSTAATNQSHVDIIALDDAMKRLTRLDARQGRIAELRYIGGLSVDETARLLEVSHRTVEHDSRLIRAWLRRELTSEELS